MNDWDRDNLEFLLSANKEVLDDWYQQLSSDDLLYAFELFAAHRAELQERVEELELLGKEEEGFPEAVSILEKYVTGERK